MATIENIKQQINTLDAGSFQSLCDAYLSKIGYPNIVSLGTEPGTRKTTKGTPDTYFSTPEGQYIFVEYTTQKTSLTKKIKDDLSKCLDSAKTGVPHNKISEIIYCHTSSNITPSQDSELKKICEEVGIQFTIIGIDRLAEELYLYHHRIALDFLGISLSTGQVQTPDDFIKGYNANKIAAPIDTVFIFREQEIVRIEEAYQNVNVVILTGPAGAGKTRLALQYANTHASSAKLYCIHNNALPIYEDLKLFIDVHGSYFIVVDDANQLSGLQHIIQYTTRQPDGYDVKVLITVRDYAVQKVINDVRGVASYQTVNIGVFTDDEIKELLKTSLGILNSNYLDRIMRIAEGNARIAVLAGKVACDTNRLDSINDVSQLYEDYYSAYLTENSLIADKNLLISTGIIAFLEAIHLDYIDSLIPILYSKGMGRDSFIENIRILHEMEIVDICNDKAVHFSEQCLSNFLLKYIYYDKQLLNLSRMIKACFQSNRERTISSINTLLNVFRNKALYEFVEEEIKTLWDELAQEQSVEFFEFVKAFYRINPTETLLILQHEIKNTESVQLDVNNIDTEKGKNYKSVSNDIIKILSGFTDMADLPTALDLFFSYYSKRPDLFIEFYHAINLSLGINKDSQSLGCFTQITLFEKFIEYSCNWQQDFVAILFIEVVETFLCLWFSPSEGGKNHTIIMYRIPLSLSDGVKAYRKLIWESIMSLSKVEKYRDKVRNILSSYGKHIEDVSVPVLQYDLSYIKSIIESSYPPNELYNCVMVEKIVQIFERMDISCKTLFSEYFKEEKYILYRLLKGPSIFSKEFDYKEREQKKKQAIEDYILTCNSDELYRVIDICESISDLDGHTGWTIGEGLMIVFDVISVKNDYYIELVRYYLKKNTPYNLNPLRLVNILFSILDNTETYNLINGFEYKLKNNWLYAYYHELPQRYIDESVLNNLYAFLLDSSDKCITSSPYRDIDFLEKYNIVDEEAFLKGCKIILAKMEYSPFIVQIYFELSFNLYHNSPQDLIQKFKGHQALLEDIYIAMLSHGNHHDYDGQFLKTIYLTYPSILDKYIGYLIHKDNGSFIDDGERNRFFFDLDNFEEVFNQILDALTQGLQFPTISLPYYLEAILIPCENKPELLTKQDIVIRYSIQSFSCDTTKMRCLFEVISKLALERRISYWLLFLEYNESFEVFKALPLTPMSWSWSGSAVPMYSAWIDFLEAFLPHFTGLKWIQHKKHVEEHIKYLKRDIEREQIDEILRG